METKNKNIFYFGTVLIVVSFIFVLLNFLKIVDEYEIPWDV